MKTLLVKVVLDEFYDKWTLSDDDLLKRVIAPINAGVKIEILKEQEKHQLNNDGYCPLCLNDKNNCKCKI